MKTILVLSVIILTACSTSSKISEYNASVYQPAKSLGLFDLGEELSRLPSVIVQGDGRLARIKFSCGTDPTFFLNGQVEPYYEYVYDKVKSDKLKSVRLVNSSDALLYGVRGKTAGIIIVETY